jgi:hypothetical protein
VASVRVTEKPDLSPVFGELDDERAASVEERLVAVDELLSALAEDLNEKGGLGFATEGVLLETELSGQAMIRVLVENAKRNVTFAAEIRPANFFGDPENPWQPGQPPLKMWTETWDVEGALSVRFKTRVAGRPYTIQEQMVEIPEKRFVTIDATLKAFAAAAEKLAELGRSREPTLQAWKPQIPESVGAPPVA